MRKIGKQKTLKGKELISNARSIVDSEKDISPQFKTTIGQLIDFTSAILDHLGINSSNSSLPPSQDPHRKRILTRGKKRKPGAQVGHEGNYLAPVKNPNEVIELSINKKSLPKGEYTSGGFEPRQVFDVEVSLKVTEYRAEILVNKSGEQFIADFPEGVTQLTQYGSSVKATSVYLSQSQLIPLNRVREFFQDQFGLPVSKGSVFNFNKIAFERLDYFEVWAKFNLLLSPNLNVDETGINIAGVGHWLHCISSKNITLLHPDKKRGKEAMDNLGVLPLYEGILTHDHWKPYFKFQNCTHSLCNAHHLRELEFAFENDGQLWARSMQKLLLVIKKATENAGGCLSEKKANKYRDQYDQVLSKAQQECPHNTKSRSQSKSRNLLQRLIDFENETLLFMEDIEVPFTNNTAENDQRMTKVQQKISGCFRTIEGARIFCRIRSYLITCRKHGISPTEALRLLFENKSPPFIN